MVNDLLKKLTEKYPFITVCIYSTVEYVGIVQNRDESITTIYDFGSLTDPDLKSRFLELANIWWWESNHSIPINIFLKQEWKIFRSSLRTFISKDLDIVHGPVCSLDEIMRGKGKRRSITLVRRMDK